MSFASVYFYKMFHFIFYDILSYFYNLSFSSTLPSDLDSFFSASNPLETIHIDMWNSFWGYKSHYPLWPPKKPTFLKIQNFYKVFKYMGEDGFFIFLGQKLSYSIKL